MGWKRDDVKAGDQVIVVDPARIFGASVGYLNKVIYPNGKRFVELCQSFHSCKIDPIACHLQWFCASKCLPNQCVQKKSADGFCCARV